MSVSESTANSQQAEKWRCPLPFVSSALFVVNPPPSAKIRVYEYVYE